ncbi:MAG: CocE/NonD family hydrolase, partial [Gemmatimonadetes bacterium]|nr:CocE/NonD family hydrolase [Gemmatimonadota bacterium]
TQQWIGQQPWCNGRIGTSGASYLALVQWLAAPLQSPYLKCMAPRVICSDIFTGLVYPGGALQLGVLMTWGMQTNARTHQSIEYHNWTEAFRYLPLIEMDRRAGRTLDFWRDWIRHPARTDEWAPTNLETSLDRVRVPALIMGGWYDVFAPASFTFFNALHQNGATPEARKTRLIVGPWPHALSQSTRTGDIDFGAASLLDLDLIELQWLDHWLKDADNAAADGPPLRLFIMGTNAWRDESEWPLARTRWQKWHLHSNGGANTILGDGALSTDTPATEHPDHFTYDPRYPVQTLGGNTCCAPDILPWGPYDQRPVEMRSDVLCYTSEPLETDLEVTGPVKAVLYAETDAPDTDWTAKLVDVSPSAYARNLCDGIIRARYRESLSSPRLQAPNTVHEYQIDLGVTANVFLKGHRIRIEVSSSNFPRFDRNPNTGHPIGLDAELRPARQTVHHSAAYPSHILLPAIPGR